MRVKWNKKADSNRVKNRESSQVDNCESNQVRHCESNPTKNGELNQVRKYGYHGTADANDDASVGYLIRRWAGY